MRFNSLLLILFAATASAAEPSMTEARQLLEATMLPKEFDAPGMMSRDVRTRLNQANQRDFDDWQKITTKAEWEKFRDARIASLKKSLGTWPEPAAKLNVRVVKTIKGDDYAIDNILYESRPRFWVTANLYRPARPGKAMPGILLVHSHHNPKHEGELQDMGVTWAKAGCCVLVIDQLGHGERRAHPFINAESYPGPFRASRQDYYFRANVGAQLALIGDSLMGWMVWDLMCGVDLLLAQPGIDPAKIIVLGAVAGGGDPAAVTAALDSRIACVVPFNFGGPQPETRPLGDNAERAFNYAGGGSWESTRNLRDSARDGFLPWVIVASVAPRHLIHAHEFAWDREHDPVWKRYQKVWGFYDAADALAYTHGRGTLTSKDPPGSHCNNIGPLHRENIHQAFAKWFGINAVEAKDRHSAAELTCWTPELKNELKPNSLDEAVRDALLHKLDRRMDATVQNEMARWKSAFPECADIKLPVVKEENALPLADGLTACRMIATLDGENKVPFLLLLPATVKDKKKVPVVIAFCVEGKAKLLGEHTQAIEALLKAGVAVCLPDLRGMGETRAGSGRGRSSAATAIAYSEQMLGTTTLGQQTRDLLSIIEYLASRPDINGQRIALWGESFTEANKGVVEVPHDAEKAPIIGEPGPGMIALIASVFDKRAKAVLARGSVDLIGAPETFMLIPHDTVVPGFAANGDLLTGLWLSGSNHMRLEGPITVQNLAAGKRTKVWPTGMVIEKMREKINGQQSAIEVSESRSKEAELAEWLAGALLTIRKH